MSYRRKNMGRYLKGSCWTTEVDREACLLGDT
jgi:hypothetical protein